MELDDDLEKRLAADVETAVGAALKRADQEKVRLLNRVDAVIVIVVLATITVMILFSAGGFAEGAVVLSNCCTIGGRMVSKKGL